MDENAWVDASYRLPDPDIRVLACFKKRVFTAWVGRLTGRWIDDAWEEARVSFWQPLPNPVGLSREVAT
jgi:hypothetical protein